MSDAEYGDRQAQAIDHCATALVLDDAGEHDEALAAIQTAIQTDTTLAVSTFFDMLRQVWRDLPAHVKEHHLRQWQQDSLELRATP